MKEEEGFNLPCPISHLLIFLGYVIFGGIYLDQLTHSLLGRAARSSAKNEAMALLALTENELRGRSKDEIFGFLSKTRHIPHNNFGFRKYNTGYECILYGGVSIATLRGKFISYDVDVVSIGDAVSAENGPCDSPMISR
jgi:hypothetical protein